MSSGNVRLTFRLYMTFLRLR